MLQGLFFVFAVSCVLSLSINRAVRELALRLGLVDRPDGHRKLQKQAVPLSGGIAIVVVHVLIIAGLLVFNPDWRSVILCHGNLGLGLLTSGVIIVVVGVADDSVGLRGRQKLAGQALAAGVLVASGLLIERVQIMDWSLDLGVFAIPLTIFWLVGAVNSLNLLDGIDGLAGTIGLILSATLAVMAFMTGHETIALIATILSGSLVGFLRFNLPPARIYLGDAGSMLIGLALGVMAIRASLKTPGTVMLAVPLALWTLPIFDTAAAILRRKLTGRSIYDSDRAHLHHRLMQRIGHRMTLVYVGAASLLTSLAALLSVWWKFDLIAVVCGGLVVGLFVSLRLFGHTELWLALVRSRALLRSILLPWASKTNDGWEDAVSLQGTRQWSLLWEALTECAGRFDFVHVHLDVNVPVLGEGFNASWNRPNSGEKNRNWRIETPLIVDERVLGWLKVVGYRKGPAGQNLERVMELVEEIELQLAQMVRPTAALSDGQAPAAMTVSDRYGSDHNCEEEADVAEVDSVRTPGMAMPLTASRSNP